MAYNTEMASTKIISRRSRAFIIDFMILLVVALFTAVTANSDSVGRVLGFTFLAGWLLYEPILLCLTGSTVGHYLCNLRVVDDRSHRNISFLKAVVRLVIKLILGICSFIAMATTSRHRAVHDLLTRSTVQIRDRSKAVLSDVENTQLLSSTMPSRIRRMLIIFCYLFASAIALGVFIRLLTSEPCISLGRCSTIENTTKEIGSLVWFAAIALFIIQGWRGRLYGCRAGDRVIQDREGGMKVWGPAATLGFAILAIAIGIVIFAFVRSGIPALAALDLLRNGTAVAIGILIGYPVQTVTLVLAAHLTGTGILTYFGLIIPRWRSAAVAVAALAGLIVFDYILMFALGHETAPVQLYIFRTAWADGTLVWLSLALIVAGPIGEELLFRGFLFRGFVHEPCDGLRGLPGILLIALIFALLHIQYDWIGVGMVFALGVMLGYVRLFTGSTILAIILHMLYNLGSVGETVVELGLI
jgi:uncharacterized protein